MSTIINSEYLIEYKRSGCKIESFFYGYDDFNDSYTIKIIFDRYNYINDLDLNKRIELTLYSPSKIKLVNFQNQSQICELEFLDYFEDGYSKESRYRIHDIEDEQVDIYFSDYKIKLL